MSCMARQGLNINITCMCYKSHRLFWPGSRGPSSADRGNHAVPAQQTQCQRWLGHTHCRRLNTQQLVVLVTSSSGVVKVAVVVVVVVVVKSTTTVQKNNCSTCQNVTWLNWKAHFNFRSVVDISSHCSGSAFASKNSDQGSVKCFNNKQANCNQVNIKCPKLTYTFYPFSWKCRIFW